jgi:hypothetical protein
MVFPSSGSNNQFLKRSISLPQSINSMSLKTTEKKSLEMKMTSCLSRKPLKGRGPRWKIRLPPADKPLNWPEGAVEDSSTTCVPYKTRY